MTLRRERRRTALLVALAACTSLTAACGLKAGVSVRSATQASPAVATGSGSGSAPGPAAATAGPVPTGGSSGPAVDGTVSTRVTVKDTGDDAAATTRAVAPVSPEDDRTGIDAAHKTIRVFLHAPGAGGSSDSFLAGARKYWEQSGPNGGPRRVLGGFRVIVDAAEATSSSKAACDQGARSSFLIVGGAASDEIQACAATPALRNRHVPYLSFGVEETGLAGLPNYFANSLTFRQQSPLVIRMARDNHFLANKWAVVTPGTATYADARESIVKELVAAGVSGKAGRFNGDKDVYITETAPSNCVGLANQLRSGGYKTVYFLGQHPLFFGQCINAYPDATYTGPGPSYAVQSVADIACRGAGGNVAAYFLHPSPDLVMSQRLAKGAPAFADDVEAGAWGAMQALEQAFTLVRASLSRQSFTSALADGRTAGGLLNPTAYAGHTHFGGTGAYADRVGCNGTTGVIKTVATYKR